MLQDKINGNLVIQSGLVPVMIMDCLDCFLVVFPIIASVVFGLLSMSLLCSPNNDSLEVKMSLDKINESIILSACQSVTQLVSQPVSH